MASNRLFLVCKKKSIITSKLSFEHKIPQFNSKVLTRNTCLTFLLNYPWKKRFFSKIVLKREDAANNWPGNWVSFTPCIQGLLFSTHVFVLIFISSTILFSGYWIPWVFASFFGVWRPCKSAMFLWFAYFKVCNLSKVDNVILFQRLTARKKWCSDH